MTSIVLVPSCGWPCGQPVHQHRYIITTVACRQSLAVPGRQTLAGSGRDRSRPDLLAEQRGCPAAIWQRGRASFRCTSRPISARCLAQPLLQLCPTCSTTGPRCLFVVCDRRHHRSRHRYLSLAVCRMLAWLGTSSSSPGSCSNAKPAGQGEAAGPSSTGRCKMLFQLWRLWYPSEEGG